MAQYKQRDPQNQYRSGILVGNFVEDTFGKEIAAQEVSRFLSFHRGAEAGWGLSACCIGASDP